MDGGKEVVDSLLGNFTDFESAVTLRGECVGIESDERVSRAMLFERVVKCEKAREISRVCYEGRPYFLVLEVITHSSNVDYTFLYVHDLSDIRTSGVCHVGILFCNSRITSPLLGTPLPREVDCVE